MKWLVRGFVIAPVVLALALVATSGVDLFSLGVIALCVLAPTALVASVAVACVLEANNCYQPPSCEQPRRIQQVTRLALSIGGFAIFATFVFGDLSVEASMLVTAGIALALAPASLVYRWPRRGPVIVWSTWAGLVALLVGILVRVDGGHITVSLGFPIATLLAILILVLPVVALVSSDTQSALPRARVNA